MSEGPALGAAGPLTVIAAACNEALQVREWLRHLQWVDRIVVVDTGSVDGTRELLSEGGAEVIEWPDPAGAIIHAAKNRAIARVAEGWILDLDLDERVPLPLRDEILARLRDRAPERGPLAYRVPYRHFVFGRWLEHGGWRTRHLRLYRAGRARYPEDRAHSTLQVDGDTEVEVDDLECHAVHFAHPRLHDFLVKMNRYTAQDAPLIVARGRGGLRNRPPLPPCRRAYLRAALGVFWNRYVRAGGFRDGMPGFLVASLLGAYAFVEQAKVWELRNAVIDHPVPGQPAGAPGGISPEDVDHPARHEQ